jgi:Holliday junction resolvase RusA-like endonuclease
MVQEMASRSVLLRRQAARESTHQRDLRIHASRRLVRSAAGAPEGPGSSVTETVYQVEPMGKVRQNRSDKWKKRPVVVRYRAYHDALREMKVDLQPGDTVEFRLNMPKSWNATKRAKFHGQPHLQKPDLDNLLGGLLDGVLEEDKGFWAFGPTRKLWHDGPSLIVIIRDT